MLKINAFTSPVAYKHLRPCLKLRSRISQAKALSARLRPLSLYLPLLSLLLYPLSLAAKGSALKNGLPLLRSESVAIRLVENNELLLTKNPATIRPIASITKLLSALLLQDMRSKYLQNMAVLNDLPLTDAEFITISEYDKDLKKFSKSRLRVGLTFAFDDLMQAALSASDNRAIYAAVRSLKISQDDFANEMNKLARQLDMQHSSFVDAAGLDPQNTSTALDLLKLIDAAANNPEIRLHTLHAKLALSSLDGKNTIVHLRNTNRLVHSPKWQVLLSKTGYIKEAGRSLVLRVLLNDRLVDMVFLGAREMNSVFGDAARVKNWLEPKFQDPANFAEHPPRETLPPLASNRTRKSSLAALKLTKRTTKTKLLRKAKLAKVSRVKLSKNFSKRGRYF